MDELAKIYPSVSVPDKDRSHGESGQRKKKKRAPRILAKSRLEELISMAHEAHQILEAKGSPYRFCVYEKDGDIFIDVVTLDKGGNPGKSFHQDISHQELEALVRQIRTGRGLVFDASA